MSEPETEILANKPVRIEEALRDRVRVLAAIRRKSMKAMLNQLLTDALDREFAQAGMPKF